MRDLHRLSRKQSCLLVYLFTRELKNLRKRLKRFDFSLGIGSTEDGTTGNDCVATRFGKEFARLRIYATVYFDDCLRTCAHDEFLEFAHLFNAVFNELLSAKTGIYRQN